MYSARVDLIGGMGSNPPKIPASTGTMIRTVEVSKWYQQQWNGQGQGQVKFLFTSMYSSDNVWFTSIVCITNDNIQIYIHAFIFKCKV